jgi:pilus assembly protein Flp/PilA
MGRSTGVAVRLISKSVSAFLRDESGATAIEYALIAAGISITIIVAVTSVGSSLSGRFVAIGSSLK